MTSIPPPTPLSLSIPSPLSSPRVATTSSLIPTVETFARTPRSRFLAAARAHDVRSSSIAAAVANAGVDLTVGAPTSSPSKLNVAFGSTKPARVKVATHHAPQVQIDRFELLDRYVDADNPLHRDALEHEVSLAFEPGLEGNKRHADGRPRTPSEFDYDFIREEDAAAARKADHEMAKRLIERNKTFLTSLDLDTQMSLMRAHYNSFSRTTQRPTDEEAHRATSPAITELIRPKTESSRSRLASQGSQRAKTSHRNKRRSSADHDELDQSEEAPAGSQSARLITATDTDKKLSNMPSKSGYRSQSHINNSVQNLHSSGTGATMSSASLNQTGFTSIGTGGRNQMVFNTTERFDEDEKLELLRGNKLSETITLPQDLMASNINQSSKILHQYRLPRHSELEKSLFVRALPGMHGIPLMSPHDVNGYVSCIPKRNLLLLNPNNLDPILPGPGAYLGLRRSEYEKEKVKVLGGVTKVVTATNGVLKDREEIQRERMGNSYEINGKQTGPFVAIGATSGDVPVEIGSVADATASHTKSGRANTSVIYKNAVLGSGGMNLNMTRARRKALLKGEGGEVGLENAHENLTTFGITPRSLGTDIIEQVSSRSRSFIGPGYYEYQADNIAGKVIVGRGTIERTELEREKEKHEGAAVASTGSGKGKKYRPALTMYKPTNYSYLPSAVTEKKRDALVNIPQDLLKNPGPGAYMVKHPIEHVPTPRIDTHHEGSGMGSVHVVAITSPTYHATGSGPLSARAASSSPPPPVASPTSSAATPTAPSGSATARPAASPTRKSAVASMTARIGKKYKIIDSELSKGYFPSAQARSIDLSHTTTLGPGSYLPSPSNMLASSNSLNKLLPNLVAFNSSTPRGVGKTTREINLNEIALMAGVKVENFLSQPSPTHAEVITETFQLTAVQENNSIPADDDEDEESKTAAEVRAKFVSNAEKQAAIAAERERVQAEKDRHRAEIDAKKDAERAVLVSVLEAEKRIRSEQLRAMSLGQRSSEITLPTPLIIHSTPNMVEAKKSLAAAVSAVSEAAADLNAPSPPSLPNGDALSSTSLVQFTSRKQTALERYEAEKHRLNIWEKAHEIEESRRSKILQSIEHRSNHIAQRSLILVTEQRWLALIVHSRFIYKMWLVNKRRQSVLQEIAAAMKIQNSWQAYRTKQEARIRFKKLMDGLKSNMLMYVIQHRIRRKKLAGNLLARFVTDFFLRRGEKMFRFIQTFRAKIIMIQRFWRKYHRKFKAQIELNLQQWNKTLNEIDNVTIMYRKKEQQALTAAQDALNASLGISSPIPAAPVHSSFPLPPGTRPKSQQSPTASGGSMISPKTPKNRPAVSAALVAKYHLNSSPLSSPRSKSKAKEVQSIHMNRLKECILEVLHARRMRIEQDRKRLLAFQVVNQTRVHAQMKRSSGHGSIIGSPVKSTGGLTPSYDYRSPQRSRRNSVTGSLPGSPLSPSIMHGAASPTQLNIDYVLANGFSPEELLHHGLAAQQIWDESYAAERIRYKSMFAAPKVDTNSLATRVVPTIPNPTVRTVPTPLINYLRYMYGAFQSADSHVIQPQPPAAEKPSPAPKTDSIAGSDKGSITGDSKEGRSISREAAVVPSKAPPKVPLKNRQPLYPTRLQSTIVLPGPTAAAAAAIKQLEASKPKNIHRAVLDAIKLRQEEKQKRKELAAQKRREREAAEPEENDDDIVHNVPTVTVNVTTTESEAKPDAAATPASVETNPLVYAKNTFHGLKVTDDIKRRLLRQLLREMRHAFFIQLSAYKYTLEEFLSSKLDSNESSLERARLMLTGKSSKLSQDQNEYIRLHPRPRFKCIIPRRIMHIVITQGYVDQTELAEEIAKKREQVLAIMHATVQPHEVPDLFHGTARGGEAPKKKAFANINLSSVQPSPMQMMRMQREAAAMQAVAATTNSSLPTSGMNTPKLIAQMSQSGSILTPSVMQRQLMDGLKEHANGQSHIDESKHSTRQGSTTSSPRPASPVRRVQSNDHPSSSTIAADTTTTAVSAAVASSSMAPSLASSKEIGALFRAHASQSSHTTPGGSANATPATRNRALLSSAREQASSLSVHIPLLDHRAAYNRQATLEASSLFQNDSRHPHPRTESAAVSTQLTVSEE